MIYLQERVEVGSSNVSIMSSPDGVARYPSINDDMDPEVHKYTGHSGSASHNNQYGAIAIK